MSDWKRAFDPISVLGDDPVIERVVVKGVEMALEQDAEGQSNWSLDKRCRRMAGHPTNVAVDCGDPGCEDPVSIGRPSADLALTRLEAAIEGPAICAEIAVKRLALVPTKGKKFAKLAAKIIPGMFLRISDLAGLDVKASLKTAALEIAGTGLGDIDTTVAAKDGGLALSPLSFVPGGGRTTGP